MRDGEKGMPGSSEYRTQGRERRCGFFKDKAKLVLEARGPSVSKS
jgi:hypothetical protein